MIKNPLSNSLASVLLFIFISFYYTVVVDRGCFFKRISRRVLSRALGNSNVVGGAA